MRFDTLPGQVYLALELVPGCDQVQVGEVDEFHDIPQINPYAVQ